MTANPWNTCFLCRSRECEVDEIHSSDDFKTVKPSSELLVKYLINCYNNESKLESYDLTQLVLKVVTKQCPVWRIKLCCRCDEVAQVIQNLKVKIETLQRNLINVLEAVRKTAILGSELDEGKEKDDIAFPEYFHVLRAFQSHINSNKGKELSLFNIFLSSSGENTADCLISVPDVEIKEEPFEESNEDLHDSWSTPYVADQTEDDPVCPPASSPQESTNMTEKPPPPPPVYKNRKRPSTQKQVSKSKRKVTNSINDDVKPSSSVAISARVLLKQTPRQNPWSSLTRPKSETEKELNETQTAEAVDSEENLSSDSEPDESDTDYDPDNHDIKKFNTCVGGWQPNLKLGTEVPTRSTRATRASGRSLDEIFTIDIKPFKTPAAPKVSKQVAPLEELTPAQKLAKMHKKLYRNRENSQHTCNLCYGRFKSYSFEHHLRSHETSEKKYTCPDCEIGFTTRQLFNVHLAAHHGAKYSCEICSARFYRLDLTKHLLDTHPGNFYQCPFCYSAFGKFASLAVHMKHHPNLELGCDLCQTPGNSLVYGRLQLLQHLHEIHNLTDFMIACDEPDCSETFYDQAAKTVHMNKHLEKYKCEFCTRCFNNKSVLHRHVLSHTGETPVECDECSERFRDTKSLRIHKMDHHGLSKHNCQYCSKEFRIPYQVTQHIKIAHGIRRPGEGFNCPTCDKWYLTKAKLKHHMASHLEKTKDFACEICGFLTTSKSLLWKHKISHSEVKKHACSYCPKRFTQASYLKDHLRTHTQEKPFQCEHCGSAYNQPGALHMHVKAKHPELIKTKSSSGTVASDLTDQASSSTTS